MKNKKKTVDILLKDLKSRYPNPKIELENWENAFQLLMCVILSAQSTDISVNKVTKKLLNKYKTPEDFANADLTELETYVSSINYYKTKAKRLIEASSYIHNELNDKLPQNIKDWVKVPGVGRKTANVIMIAGQKIKPEGIVVDTHVTRVANRLKLTEHEKNAVKIESDLKDVIPENEWGYVSKSIVLFGRYVCKAKKPDCENCNLKDICPYYKNVVSKEEA